MNLVHQIIPENHVRSFCERGMYFAPCRSFVDLLEFRYGYCLYNHPQDWPENESCVHATFGNERINATILGTCLSCWSEDQRERYAMWESYGRRGAAIRVSMPRDQLIEQIRRTGNAGAAGSVRYGLAISNVRPEFLQPFNGLTPEQQEDFHLFFHKHPFYINEDEFRIVVFGAGPLIVPIGNELVSFITISPFGLSANTRSDLEDLFGDRVYASSLRNPYQA